MCHLHYIPQLIQSSDDDVAFMKIITANAVALIHGYEYGLAFDFFSQKFQRSEDEYPETEQRDIS